MVFLVSGFFNEIFLIYVAQKFSDLYCLEGLFDEKLSIEVMYKTIVQCLLKNKSNNIIVSKELKVSFISEVSIMITGNNFEFGVLIYSYDVIVNTDYHVLPYDISTIKANFHPLAFHPLALPVVSEISDGFLLIYVVRTNLDLFSLEGFFDKKIFIEVIHKAIIKTSLEKEPNQVRVSKDLAESFVSDVGMIITGNDFEYRVSN